MQSTPQQNVSPRAGFFREALSELRRKLERRKLRKQAHQLDQQRTTALGAAGQRAWQAKIDLSAFPDLRDQLARLDARTGELTSTAKKLGEEKASLEGRRQAETARFDAARAAIEEKKRPVDVALKAAQDRLNEQNQTLQRLQARQAALPAERAAVEQQLATLAGSAAPDRAAQIAAAENRKQQLELEQKHMAERLPLAQQGVPPLAAEVQRLFAESQRYAGEIQRVESERNSSLSPILAGLERVQRDTSTASQEASTVHQERQGRFVQLGLALYEAKVSAPPLAPTIEQVAAIDRTRSATNAALEASLSLSRAVPRGTMLKFVAAVVLAPALLVGVGYWLYSSAPSSHARGTTARNQSKFKMPTLRESEKDTMANAFVESLRNPSRAPDEKTRLGAVHVLMDDLLTLGSTADPQYLPLLARVLRSDVPDLRAAAADAIGMIGPTADQTPPLTAALNDPVPAVRQAAAEALRSSGDSSARYLLERARVQRKRGSGYTPDPVPGDQTLGAPVYPGATFLYFASDLNAGRAAFATPDSTTSVLSFYTTKAQHPAMTPDEAAHAYPGAPGMADYINQRLYGNPMIVVLQETASGGVKPPTQFAVVFEDRALKQTGFVLHFVPPAPPPAPPRGAEAEGIEQ